MTWRATSCWVRIAGKTGKFRGDVTGQAGEGFKALICKGNGMPFESLGDGFARHPYQTLAAAQQAIESRLQELSFTQI